MENNSEYQYLRLKIKELESELEHSKNNYALFKRNFMSALSHELRTPLNSILGFSKLLVDSSLNKAQKQEYFKYISTGSERLINLINEMVQLALINTEKIKPELDKFNISELFDSVHKEVNERITQRPDNKILLSQRKDIDSHDFIILSDENKLNQVLQLLLNHVLRNTSNGTVEYGYIFLDCNYIQFYIEDRRENSYKQVIDLLYESSDKDDQEIFKNQNPNTASFGLSISKMIIEALGGDIWIKNNHYAGYTINFILPVNEHAIVENDCDELVSSQKSSYNV